MTINELPDYDKCVAIVTKMRQTIYLVVVTIRKMSETVFCMVSEPYVCYGPVFSIILYRTTTATTATRLFYLGGNMSVICKNLCWSC